MTLYFALVENLEAVSCFLEDYEVGLDPKKLPIQFLTFCH